MKWHYNNAHELIVHAAIWTLDFYKSRTRSYSFLGDFSWRTLQLSICLYDFRYIWFRISRIFDGKSIDYSVSVVSFSTRFLRSSLYNNLSGEDGHEILEKKLPTELSTLFFCRFCCVNPTSSAFLLLLINARWLSSKLLLIFMQDRSFGFSLVCFINTAHPISPSRGSVCWK